MSTTIRPRYARAASTVARVALVLGAWSGIMLVLPFLGPPDRPVAVLGDGSRVVRIIAAAGGRIVKVQRGGVVARGVEPGFVRALYANGARAVVVARAATGCGGAERACQVVLSSSPGSHSRLAAKKASTSG